MVGRLYSTWQGPLSAQDPEDVLLEQTEIRLVSGDTHATHVGANVDK